MPEQKPYRLPITVIPERYEIKLAPDFPPRRLREKKSSYSNCRARPASRCQRGRAGIPSRFDQRARRQGGAGECGFGHRERAGDLRLP